MESLHRPGQLESEEPFEPPDEEVPGGLDEESLVVFAGVLEDVPEASEVDEDEDPEESDGAVELDAPEVLDVLVERLSLR